jgi:hypothetical protein
MRYAECHYAECRGALFSTYSVSLSQCRDLNPGSYDYESTLLPKLANLTSETLKKHLWYNNLVQRKPTLSTSEKSAMSFH